MVKKRSNKLQTNRKNLINKRWQSDTECPQCARQMFFTNHESAEAFLKRIEDRGRLAETIFLSLRVATVDHKIMTKDGGSDEIENLRIMCRFCNEKRQGHTPYGIVEWTDHE